MYNSDNKTFATTLMRWANYSVTYRIPVYVLTFLLIVAPLRYRYVALHPEVLVVALCFTSLMVFVYLLNKVTDTVEDAINLRGGPISEAARQPTHIVALLCLWAPLGYLIFAPEYLPLYAVVAVLGYYYSRPVPFFAKKVRLKQILFIKNTVSACIWSLPPVGIQMIVLSRNITDPAILKIAVLLFCISYTFEALWDVRDMEGDKVAGVHTIANTFGVVTTQVFALVLLGVFLLLFGIMKHPYLSVLVAVISILFIAGTNPGRRAWFYHSILGMWIGVLIAVFCI